MEGTVEPMMAGTLLQATGACPVCGRNVARTHGWNGTTMSDRYACAACGESVYLSARTMKRRA